MLIALVALVVLCCMGQWIAAAILATIGLALIWLAR